MVWLLIISCICFACSPWRMGLGAGIAAQFSYLFYRGIILGRLPLLGPHDTLIFFSLSVGVMGLVVSFSPALRSLRWPSFSSGIAAGLITLGALRFPPLNVPLPQILDTLWFELHVVLAFFAYALFTISGIMCGFFLFSGNEKSYLDVFSRAILTGWIFFSASMITGGIWGYYAWGTYWLWTPKELWTSILWLYYALVLHLRYKGAGRDTLTAWLGIAGVAVMLFTYLGVSLLMKSSHSF